MGLNRERITLNPLEESGTNMPLEVAGDRFGHGIFIQANGSQWPSPAVTPQLAQSVDTEGALAVATTVGTKTITLKVQVLEPSDPASTNYYGNPQCIQASNYGLNGSGNVVASAELVRDLVGYDYATAATVTTAGASNMLTTLAFSAALPAGTSTMGVWMKGQVGGEQITLGLQENGVGTSTSAVTLTTSWQFYTVSRTWSTGTQATLTLTAAATATPTWYATGLCLVSGTLTEPFDGTFPGCSWNGPAHNSPSSRPSTGGPRLNAIMKDLESAAENISRYRTGTIRRTTPNQAAANTRATYDLIGATLNWDDESMKNAGVVKGTLTLLAEPYARGPEMTQTAENWTPPLAANWEVDSGAFTDWTKQSGGIYYSGSTPTAEYRWMSIASPYGLPAGEVSAQFTPGTTISGVKAGVVIRRVDPHNYLEAYVTDNGTNSILNLDKVIGGTRTNVATATLGARIAAATHFVVRGRVQNQNGTDNVYVEYFAGTADPVSSTQTPTAILGPYNPTDQVLQSPGNFTGGIVVIPQMTGTGNFIVGEIRVTPYLARERTATALRFTLPNVPGSAPGLGRMVVQDDSGHDQFWMQWGAQHDRLSRLSSTTDLFYEAENLTPLNGASVVTAATYSGGKYVAATTYSLSSVPILSTQLSGSQLSHIGNFRVFARVGYNFTTGQYASGTPGNGDGVYWALQWSVGDLLSWTVNDYALLSNHGGAHVGVGTAFGIAVVDLGVISIPEVTAGPQQWQGNILMLPTNNIATSAVQVTTLIDCLWLVPVDDGGAEVSGTWATMEPSFTQGSLEVIDTFTTIASGNLGGTAPTYVSGGGTWTTSGATTDFGETSSNVDIIRTTTSDTGAGRIAVIGPSLTNTAVWLQCKFTASTPAPSVYGILLRYSAGSGIIIGLEVAENLYIATLSGTTITYISDFYGIPISSVGTQLYAAIDGDNRVFVYGSVAGSGSWTRMLVADLSSTTGVPASGQAGIIDYNSSSTACTRTYSNFQVMSPPSDAAIFSGNQLEIRSDRANRQSSNGSLWVPPSSYVGDYMKVANPTFYDGATNLIVKTSRNDPSLVMKDYFGDAIEAQVNVTPRYATQADE